MGRKIVAVVAASLASLALVAAAGAITWGQRDGNAHPNVGALVAEWRTPGVKDVLCSGTLIAPQVFLTASHCTAYLESRGISDVWVTLNTNSALGSYHHGTMHTNPLYNQAQSDSQDIAVVTLDMPVAGVAPAQLPAAGLLDRMKKDGSLRSTTFTAVGYGDRERTHAPGSGSPQFPFDGYRWTATSSFNALTGAWLRLSQNNATGNGGTCFGDSGGPNFLGTSNVVAGITIAGDSACVSTNVDYRLDTGSARAFLGQFVTLP